MSKRREFWLYGGMYSGTSEMEDTPVQILEFDPKDPCTHVVEHSAYTALEEKLRVCEVALEFYANKVRLREVSVTEYSHTTGTRIVVDDGYTARAALEKIRGMK